MVARWRVSGRGESRCLACPTHLSHVVDDHVALHFLLFRLLKHVPRNVAADPLVARLSDALAAQPAPTAHVEQEHVLPRQREQLQRALRQRSLDLAHPRINRVLFRLVCIVELLRRREVLGTAHGAASPTRALLSVTRKKIK